jgi:hypothetical protein
LKTRQKRSGPLGLSPRCLGFHTRGSVALQRALNWLRFFFMQAMMALSLPIEPMQCRITSEVQAARCAAVPRAKLGLENNVVAAMIAAAMPMWRETGLVRLLSWFEIMTLSCARRWWPSK